MLKQKIDTDIALAMKSKNESLLRTLRSIKSAISMVETQKGHSGIISEAEETQLLNKQIKQRRESIDLYKTNNRLDLLKIEEEELTILESLLPKQLSEEELVIEIKAILATIETPTIGNSMKLVMVKLNGKGDNKMISSITKSLL